MSEKNNRILLLANILSYFMVAALISFVPFLSPNDGTVVFYFCSSCFWVFLIAGIAIQFILSKRIRNWVTINYAAIQDMELDPQCGLLSVFKNIPGIISDIIFFLSFIVFIIAAFFLDDSNTILCCVFLSLTFFSFCSHCIFNGKNYFFIINQQKIENHLNKLRRNHNEEN